MSKPVWITTGGNLGTFREAEFYSLPLEVNNPTGSPVTFSFLSGQLPPGLQVVRSGILQGVPIVTDPGPKDETRTYRFTIRASCQTPTVVVDRTFNFTVSNIKPPEIIPTSSLLGEFFDGTPIDHALYAREFNPEAKLVWSIKEGELPPGIRLTADGHLVGYIGLSVVGNAAGRLGYDGQATQAPTVFATTSNTSVPSNQTFGSNGNPYSLQTVAPYGDTQRYEELPYDFTTSVSQNKNYTFTVQVFDGANYDTQTYVIKVISKGSWTADNSINTVDDNFITTDADQFYSPVITTTVNSLPVVRQNSNFSFKFSAIDYYGTQVTWSSNIKDSLPGMDIDPATGWLTGHIGTQIDYRKTYNFKVWAANTVPQYNLITANYIAGGVSNSNIVLSNVYGIRPGMLITGNGFGVGQQVYRVYANSNTVGISSTANSTPSGTLTFSGNLTSVPVVYSLTVLGDINNQIIWDTPTLVGNIVNGGISELSIVAHNSLGKAVTYQLVHGTLADNVPATGTEYSSATLINLPQGLQLLPSGRIIGRTTFRHFQLDTDKTTIDGYKTKFDNIHTFTAKATTVDNTVADTKTFKIRVNDLYAKPYENLYMKPLPNIGLRRLLVDILSDPSMFPDGSIYRIDDPNFGKAKDFRFLAVPGVEPSLLSSYAEAVVKNFYNVGIINFGPIKTAIATDPNNNYAVKYEVVYVEIVNPFNPSGSDVAIETDLRGSTNHITNPYYDPQGVAHYVINPNTFNNMETRIRQNLGYSAQGVIPDWMTSVQEDKSVIGFKRVLVLAYTNPGEAKKIAWRLQDRGIDLATNAFNLTLDRYLVDNTLSSSYDIAKQSFVPSRETTFDYLTLLNSSPVETVDYAVSQPFVSINNRSMEIILNNGGIDQVGSFRNGDRLIFAQQEKFNTNYSEDGWIYYTDLYLGNYSDINDVVDISYYDSTGFDSSYVVPGYVQRAASVLEPQLVSQLVSGSSIIYISYSTVNYVGKTLAPNAFIDYNTTITAQSAVSGVGSGLALKLTLSKPAVGTAAIGAMVAMKSYLVVTDVDPVNHTVTVDSNSLPILVANRLQLIENAVTGFGIPAGTRISRIVNNTVTLENYNDFSISIRAGDYLGYSVQNQRAGIWEIQIDPDTENVRLEFVKELVLGQIVKVLNGKSHGQSFVQYQAVGAKNQYIPFSNNVLATVPFYKKVPNTITYNGTNGNRTRFDSDGTKFFDHRDLPAQAILPPPEPWQEGIAYNINSTVSYQGYYYRAIRPVLSSRAFQTDSWQKYEVLSVSGDKYIKFPKIGVFN
jgi:hypothetical protein